MVTTKSGLEATGSAFSTRRVFLPPPVSRQAEFWRLLLLLLGVRRRAHQLVLDSLNLTGDENVLHVGCHTGGLSLALLRRWPRLELEAVDSDEVALELAVKAAAKAGARVLFKKGYLQDLPVTTERHDVVVEALSLHRLGPVDRKDALQEFQRVLKPGGCVLLVDYGEPAGGLGGWLVGKLVPHERGLPEQLAKGLEALLRQEGFAHCQTLAKGPFGLQVVTGQRP
jgi:ubiquinone/menaquinone biosynthesis C-methylase UbiE